MAKYLKPQYKELSRLFNSITGAHQLWELWEDGMTMFALMISNTVDKRYYEKREKDKFVNVADLKRKLRYWGKSRGASKQSIESLMETIGRIPYSVKAELEATLETEPVKRGKWIRTSEPCATTPVQHCSECGASTNYDLPFCPDCGAKMEGGT